MIDLPEARAAGAHRFTALDGWRGLAALAVAFYHVPIDHPLRHAANWKNFEIFVDFFFVLSGFVIMHAWGGRLTDLAAARTFMVKRFWRVWPLHFTILMAFLALELAKLAASTVSTLPLDGVPFTSDRTWSSVLTNIVMIQALNLHGTTTWNGPSWSISVEFWTYAIFAVTMLAFRAQLNRALVGGALIAAVGLAAFSPIYLFATHDFGLLRSVYGFFLGAATYRVVRSGRVEIGTGTGLESAALLILASFVLSTGVNVTSLAAPLVFAGVILVFSRGNGLVTRILNSPAIQATGRWSYSIYLIHVLLNYFMAVALVAGQKFLHIPLTITASGSHRLFSFGSSLLDSAAVIAMLGLTIVLASLSYRHIELPFMRSPPARRPAAARGRPLAA